MSTLKNKKAAKKYREQNKFIMAISKESNRRMSKKLLKLYGIDCNN